jgi:riboflavin synthase
MFSGIIEEIGKIRVAEETAGRRFEIEADFSSELALGESVCVSGVCLTVTDFSPKTFACFASKETLSVTALGALKSGSFVNLERSMKMGDRISGHLVYGHVDTTARLQSISGDNDSHVLTFSCHKKNRPLLISKGSVAVSGISLTLYELEPEAFRVMIIPHTWQHTNLKHLAVGDAVNIEFDMLSKMISEKLAAFQNENATT